MSSELETHSHELVKEAERAWHDQEYSAHADSAYPNTVQEFLRVYLHQHLTPFSDGGWSWWADARQEMLQAVGDVRGLRVLDYGCGYGLLGMYLSLHGADVWGFDLSEAAVATARGAASRYGSGAQFCQMDAARLDYPDGFFDIAVGFGVLHHVMKYPQTGQELHRVLKPGAVAYFHETLWDNPVINLARRFTSVDPEAGDAHLTDAAIRAFARDFREVTLKKRHLLYMLKRLAPLPAGTPWDNPTPRPFWGGLKRFDDQLSRFRPLQRFCGEVIVELQK